MEKNSLNSANIQPIGKELIKRQQTLAVAESVTSGLLQYAFSTIEDASLFFHGGITAYNLGQKYKHLTVEPIHAMAVDCVSQRVADEMAINVLDLFSSDWGIGITGYATHSGGAVDELFAFYSLAFRDKVLQSGRLVSLKEDPPQVQLDYTNQVLDLFKAILLKDSASA